MSCILDNHRGPVLWLHVRYARYWRHTWHVSDYALSCTLPMQSMPITTKVMSLNTAHGEVYLIQHYVIKFVSDLMQVCGFLRVLQFPPPINLPPVYSWNSVESGDKHHNPYHLYKCKMYMPNTSIILLFNLLILHVIHDVPGESYSKNMLCALN